MPAFVTGASGFVGRQLVADLLARGQSVRGLARSEAAAATVAALGAEVIRGDLEDAVALRAGMTGCDAVFHAAAKVELWGQREDFERVTILGTRRVLAAAAEAGVARFVHVSTEAVLLGGPEMIDADETWPLPQNPLGLYPWSKGRAEEEVRAAARAGLNAVIVRPRAIWGAGDNVSLPKLCAAVDAKKFAWIAHGRPQTSTCHVKNVSAGLLAAAERGRTGETYFVTDDEQTTIREYLGGLLATTGRDVSQAPSVPLPVARLLARLFESIWRLTRRAGEPPLTRSVVELIGTQVTVKDEKARQELSYRPVIARAEGLAEMRAAAAG